MSDEAKGSDQVETATVTFISKGSNFRAVMQTALTSFDAQQRIVHTPEVVLEFAPHGRYTTSDEVEVEYLRSLGSYNKEFFEQGNEPGALKPTVDEQLSALVKAGAELDAERIEEVLAGERATHARPMVIAAGETGLRTIAQIKAEAARSQEPAAA